MVLLRKAAPLVRGRAEEAHTQLETAARELGAQRREVEESRAQLRALGDAAKAQMKRGFEEIRERIRTREAELFRRVDEVVTAENSAMEQDLEFLVSRQTRLEDVASALVTHTNSGDDVLSLQSYAEAKGLAQEAANNQNVIRAPKMQIPPEQALQHSEVVNAIHSALTDMQGLIPSMREVLSRFKKAPVVTKKTPHSVDSTVRFF